MITEEKVKIAAYIAMAGTVGWLAIGLVSGNGLLNQALGEIKAARVEIKSAKIDIDNAKMTIDSAQKVLGVLRFAAENAQKDLERLKGQREKISSDISSAIANSRLDLKKYGNSIQDLLNEQNQMIRSLDSIDIRTLIVVPAK
jgi:chromosome segregation ATPase